MWIGFKKIPADDYHGLNITQKLSAENTGYHSANDMVPNGDIASALDNLEMTAIEDQSHMDQLMAIIY